MMSYLPKRRVVLFLNSTLMQPSPIFCVLRTGWLVPAGFHIKKLNGNDQIIFECWLLTWVLNVSVTWRPDSSPVQHCPLANENKNTSKLKRICLQLKKWDEERSRENELKKRRFSRGPFSQFWSEGPSHCHKSTGIPSVPTASKTKLVFSFSAVV